MEKKMYNHMMWVKEFYFPSQLQPPGPNYFYLWNVNANKPGQKAFIVKSGTQTSIKLFRVVLGVCRDMTVQQR